MGRVKETEDSRYSRVRCDVTEQMRSWLPTIRVTCLYPLVLLVEFTRRKPSFRDEIRSSFVCVRCTARPTHWRGRLARVGYYVDGLGQRAPKGFEMPIAWGI